MNDAFERLLQAELSISQRIDELSVESRSLHNVIVLYTSLKAELRSLHHLINDTKQLAYEQDSKSEEQALLTKLEWHTNEYKVYVSIYLSSYRVCARRSSSTNPGTAHRLQDRLCKANLQANANVAKQLELDRKALLSAGPVALQRDVLRTAEAVTESLERTLSRLITEVERSGAALGTLSTS